jgi:hypothetical protein
MSGVFQNIEILTPLRPASVYVPPASLVEEGVWGSIVRKTPDTALYSIYVRTLCTDPSDGIRRPEGGSGTKPQILFAQLLSGAARRTPGAVKSVLTPSSHSG